MLNLRCHLDSVGHSLRLLCYHMIVAGWVLNLQRATPTQGHMNMGVETMLRIMPTGLMVVGAPLNMGALLMEEGARIVKNPHIQGTIPLWIHPTRIGPTGTGRMGVNHMGSSINRSCTETMIAGTTNMIKMFPTVDLHITHVAITTNLKCSS